MGSKTIAPSTAVSSTDANQALGSTEIPNTSEISQTSTSRPTESSTLTTIHSSSNDGQFTSPSPSSTENTIAIASNRPEESSSRQTEAYSSPVTVSIHSSTEAVTPIVDTEVDHNSVVSEPIPSTTMSSKVNHTTGTIN